MANVLSEERRQQVVALGRLGWSLRRIQDETAVRREPACASLKPGSGYSSRGLRDVLERVGLRTADVDG